MSRNYARTCGIGQDRGGLEPRDLGKVRGGVRASRAVGLEEIGSERDSNRTRNETLTQISDKQ